MKFNTNVLLSIDERKVTKDVNDAMEAKPGRPTRTRYLYYKETVHLSYFGEGGSNKLFEGSDAAIDFYQHV